VKGHAPARLSFVQSVIDRVHAQLSIYRNFLVRSHFYFAVPHRLDCPCTLTNRCFIQAQLIVALSSAHGLDCPMPMIETISWIVKDLCVHGEVDVNVSKDASHPPSKRARHVDLKTTARPKRNGCLQEAAILESHEALRGSLFMRKGVSREIANEQCAELQLHVSLQAAADEALRFHAISIRLNLHNALLTPVDHSMKDDTAWSTAKCQCLLSLKSQVRHSLVYC
jgi:hypothetical protein